MTSARIFKLFIVLLISIASLSVKAQTQALVRGLYLSADVFGYL